MAESFNQTLMNQIVKIFTERGNYRYPDEKHPDKYEHKLSSYSYNLVLPKYTKENDDYKYILTVMDVFSKYAWVRVTKTKDKRIIADAFEDIIEKSSRQCKKLWTDNGGEFYNKYFESMLKTYNIKRYTTQSELKAIMAGRFNQTLMNQIVKIFTERGNYIYIDEIQTLVTSYNNTYH